MKCISSSINTFINSIALKIYRKSRQLICRIDRFDIYRNRKKERKKEGEMERETRFLHEFIQNSRLLALKNPHETSIRIAYYSTIHWNGLDRYKARGRLINSIASDKASYSSFNHRDICFGCKSNSDRDLYTFRLLIVELQRKSNVKFKFWFKFM